MERDWHNFDQIIYITDVDLLILYPSLKGQSQNVHADITHCC